MASYRVIVYDAAKSGNWGPSTVITEFENPKNLGYATYLNDIGEAFFTINQRHPKADIREHFGVAHVVIIREGDGTSDVVWRGVLGETDSNQDDNIIYAYGYEHILFHLFTPWNKRWKNVAIAGSSNRPIDQMFNRAKNMNDSQLGFATLGTTQAPWVQTGGSDNLILNTYRVNYKRILTMMRELTAIATSDTRNVVYMEFDYPTSPTDLSLVFNYWRDRSVDRVSTQFRKPGNIMQFADRFAPIQARNKLWGVASGPRGQLYKSAMVEAGGHYGRNNFGMKQDTMYLTWVRDQAELNRVTRRRLRQALREDVDLYLRLFPDAMFPIGSSLQNINLGDQVYVKIDHGNTHIDKFLMVMGQQVVWTGGREYVQPIVSDRGGA